MDNNITIKPQKTTMSNSPVSFILLCLVRFSAALTVLTLGALLIFIFIRGVPYLKPSLFAWEYTKENVSMLPAIINTLTVTALTLLFSVPLGVGAAIFLVEYAKRGNKIVEMIRLATETLSGIPSIIYGLFGFLVFAVACNWGYSLLGGALTLSIMVLPVIMRTTEEALLTVSDSYREGSYGLGAGKIRTIFSIVLPSALPGILNGIILASGRTVGETAALLYTSGTRSGIPSSVMGSGRTLSVHMYALLSEGLYINQAYASGVVLIIIVMAINFLSNTVAKRMSRE